MSRKMWKGALMMAVGVVVIGVWLVVLSAVSANAQPIEPLDVDLPISTTIRGAPGSVHHVGTIDAQAGHVCVAELSEFRNRRSIHPGNDILAGPVVFANVESGTFEAAGISFTATGPIEVSVRLGADAVFSAGFLLEVTCNPPTTTTTSQPEVTTTSSPTPESSSTTLGTPTTLSPPPEGGVPAGGGSEAVASVSDVATQLGLALLVIGAGALIGGWWVGRRHDDG